MAGERTPDTSHARSPGSSDDDISLREHMQRQIDSLERNLVQRMEDMRDLLDERYVSQAKAIDKVEMATEKRFEAVNEFRAQLNDQARTFMPRAESISRHDRNAEAVGLLQQRHDQDMAAVNKRLDLDQGASSGLDKAWGYIIGAVGLAGGVVGLVIATR